MRKIIFMALVAVLAVGFGFTPAQAEVANNIAAPDFTLQDSSGQTRHLSDFAGNYIVLEWLNHECPFVQKHYGSGNMQALQKEFTDKGVVWLSIISSSPGKQGYCTPEKANQLMAEKSANPTAVLLDPTGQVGKTYGAKTTPHMFVINSQGSVIYQGAIDSIASANPADIAQAENYVKSALNQAMDGQPVTQPVTKSYGCSVKY